MSGIEGEAARATIGALPPNPPQPVESQQAGQQTPEVAQSTEDAGPTVSTESATAPTQSAEAEFGAAAAALDPLAFVGSIKTMVGLGVKVLGLVARFPGPQQATAQELLKVLNEVNSVLNRLPF